MIHCSPKSLKFEARAAGRSRREEGKIIQKNARKAARAARFIARFAVCGARHRGAARGSAARRAAPALHPRAARTSSVRAPMSHTRASTHRTPSAETNEYATSTLHPIGQPGELLPAGPHAELLFMVGVERRAGARGGHQSLHLVRVRVWVKVGLRFKFWFGLRSGHG